MPVKKNTLIDKMKSLKDLIYIFLFLVTVVGWIRSETRNKVVMEVTIQNNTKAIENNTAFIEKFNEYMLEQNKFNGQVMQHMKENP